MKDYRVCEGVHWVGAVDWFRRTFDALIPLPEGTGYNAYLVEGRDRTALLDTVDPAFTATLIRRLQHIDKLDYIIAHHAEQDHSGALPAVLERFPGATVLCSAKARSMLLDLLPLPDDRIRAVEDGEVLNLGGRTLQFHYMPWVHWPETMVTWMEDAGVLFSCDFFGSHLAQSGLFAEDWPRVAEAARLYYAQIMMPYARVIRKHLEKVRLLKPRIIAPSHGPVHGEPGLVLDAYAEWLSEAPRNRAVLASVSMHGSTAALADALAEALEEQGVGVERFDLTAPALDRLASELVDAATLILASPAIWNGLHPAAHAAAYIINGLKPGIRWAGVIGSYGWGARALENASEGLLPDVKPAWLPPVACRGAPGAECYEAIGRLAADIAANHRGAGLRN